MHILLIFLDGIGLGEDAPDVNPFSIADTPTLLTLSNQKRWIASTHHEISERAVFIALDAQLGVAGRPQSGTNQAVILTGHNIPQLIGKHYGPKPNQDTRDLIAKDNFFMELLRHDKTAAHINAFPPRLHRDIERGKTLRSSLQQAVFEAGLPMFTVDHLRNGQALSEDWTGEGWHKHLGYRDTPIFPPEEGGKRMVEISRQYDFALFTHWITDYIGHRGTLNDGVQALETFDKVMRGALAEWKDDEGLIIITSDHGNMEVIGDRKHTENRVPTVIIGEKAQEFTDGLTDLTGLVPRMRKYLIPNSETE